MQSYKNLVLIGTSHIAKESIDTARAEIQKIRPSIVALELDKNRLHGLITKEKGNITLKHARQIGLKGYLFAKIGHFVEIKLGKMVGVSPGEDMLAGYETGKAINAKVALIDQDIQVTLKKFSKEITWKEKFRLVMDIIKAPFSKKKIQIDLSRVPDKKLIKQMLEQTKERYPNFYKVIVEDRNKYMAKKLFILMKNYEKVLALIGAGHEEEIIKYIKELEKSN